RSNARQPKPNQHRGLHSSAGRRFAQWPAHSPYGARTHRRTGWLGHAGRQRANRRLGDGRETINFGHRSGSAIEPGAHYRPPGATCPTYILAATTPADNGALFLAAVSNSFSGATSAQAMLAVITDTNPPAMVSAFGTGIPPTVFDLVYSEPVNVTDAQDTFNY